MRKTEIKPHAFAILVTLGLAIVLAVVGQVGMCDCSLNWFWSPDAWTKHTSQHFLDPYSFTHFCHGLLFFWALKLALPKWDNGHRFKLAILLEACWEMLENSPIIIEQYRKSTASAEYFGDSILNSAGDMVSCALGFVLASQIPWWGALLVFGFIEVGLLATIRDNLTLNIITLLSDQPNIVKWQQQGQ